MRLRRRENPQRLLLFAFFVYTRHNKVHTIMLRNITLSADEQLIVRAREKAGAAQTTLNVEFRKWLATYSAAQDDTAVARFQDVMKQLTRVDAGRSFTRDEMNER